MGNQKLKWTQEEEKALLAGIQKHGPGKWKNILKDPEFAPSLIHRSNIDLKDKWRNLSVSGSTQGSKDKQRTPKLKAIEAAPLSVAQNSAPSSSVEENAAKDMVVYEPANGTHDSKNGPRWNAMIFEALAAVTDSSGLDLSGIVNYIEQRTEVAQNFRRLLGSRLRRLLGTGKIEKVGNCYMLKKDAALGVKTPTPKQKDIRPQNSKNSGLVNSGETVEDASIMAAYKVVEAENKSFMAAEAVKELERVSKVAEDAESILQLVKDIYEQSSRGEIVVLA